MGGEAGTSGFLCVSDSDRRVPAELGQPGARHVSHTPAACSFPGDCALLALAACHRRGMVCNQLSLFSPLFCAWAWWCLRLGLAFRMVVNPQSGLLAQVSLLR